VPHTTRSAVDALFAAFRESDFLNLTVSKAAQLLGITPREAQALAERAPELEVQRRNGANGPFYVIRAALTPEALARLAPVPVDRLRKAYAGSAAGRQALEQVLTAGGKEGPFHVAQGEVRPGPGVSDVVQLAQPGCMDQAPAVYDLPALREPADLRVLSHLEDLEAERINFGVYDTFVSFGELHAHVTRADPGLPAADATELQASLERLRAHQFLFSPAPERYRSRISETVRVLKRVKQRFRDDDAATAPHLVHSVRVHFEDRKRLERRHGLAEALEQVFQHNRGAGRKVDRARKALQQGFAAAMGEPLDKVRLTRIQRDALEQLARQYFAQEGRGYVVSGNTGSGKTEAALLPLLLGAMEEKLRAPEGVDGCKVLLVYPRQELAKNQLQRLCRYLAFINRELGEMGAEQGMLSAGILFQETPGDQGELTDGGRFHDAWERAGDGRVLPYFVNEHDGQVTLRALNDGVGALRSTPGGFADGGWELEGFRATRKSILNNPPDVLVITTEMLHRWLMNPDANRFFGLPREAGRGGAPFAAPRAVVFDEIHLYDTTHGAQIGMLIRRLRQRLFRAMSAAADGWRFPLVIGMSATIGNAKAFWSELSGLAPELVVPLTPRPEDLEPAQGREYFLFIRPETYSRGKLVGDASVAIQSIMSLAHNLRRRNGEGDGAPKHRTLVFQDSISKVKKLALEFHDAETNRFLARHRLARPAGPDLTDTPEYRDGEYWVFDAEDPFQYSDRRPAPGSAPCSLTSPQQPVFSGNKGTHLLKKDILFATTVLEVGYDDPSIQFVFQHHAPRTAASFVQKKGRAGRSLQDRPMTAVTLSRHSYRDAFYYQNPRLLYDPADYRPPLNVENYFVQRFQSLALLFDELARLTGRNLARLDSGPSADDVHARLREVDAALGRLEATLEASYQHVAAASFRRVHPTLRGVWDGFRADFQDRQVLWAVLRARNLLQGHPEIPENLFGSVNLPTLRVLHSGSRPTDDWDSAEEDVALAFGEVPPGKVTRRYGRGHRLFWRRPKPWVAIERFKTNRRDGRPDGPFDPALLKPLARLWGADWADYLPRHLHRIYGDRLPERFYRARYMELWDFGTLDPRHPAEPQESWVDWGELLPSGEVVVRYWGMPSQSPPVQQSDHFRRTGDARTNPWRRVSPDSTSYPLSSAYVRPFADRGGPVPDAGGVELPPLFPGLLDEVRLYCGEVEGRRSAMDVWEIHYGAEATVRLKPQRAGDPHAGTGHALVRYHSDHDREPTLYGYDLTTEGLRVPYDRDRLAETAAAVFDQVWADPFRQSHLQDQYLRYLLKTESWPAGAADPMNVFDVRVAADLISTLRAESRAGRGLGLDAFLAQLTDAAGLTSLLADVRTRYWRDRRVLNDEFIARLTSSLTAPGTRAFLDSVFARLQRREDVQTYLQVTLLHSLKHAVRHLFITEGSTRDEEVGSFGMFPLTHRDWSPGRDFYVYERHQDGSGATRLVGDVLREKGLAHRVERWWDVTLACPVGDEEDFLRAALRQHGPELRGFSEAFFAAAPTDRSSPEAFLQAMFPAIQGADDGFLVRLGGILTAELTFGGSEAIPVVALHVEIQQLEDALAQRFHRHPTPGELAGYAATEVENDTDGTRLPALGRLRALYQEHAHRLGEHDDEAPSNDLERFMDQVQHLGLGTCTDACPACLASDCDLGHVDVMRHTLSRRHLKTAHRLLSAHFTVAYEIGVTTVDDLLRAAEANGGWAILTYGNRISPELGLALRSRFEQVGRIFDHERMELRMVLRLLENA
jgi:hypothetical protein